jgi:hypothetical protein
MDNSTTQADLAKRAANMSKYIMGSDEATVKEVSDLLAECAAALGAKPAEATECGECGGLPDGKCFDHECSHHHCSKSCPFWKPAEVSREQAEAAARAIWPSFYYNDDGTEKENLDETTAAFYRESARSGISAALGEK